MPTAPPIDAGPQLCLEEVAMPCEELDVYYRYKDPPGLILSHCNDATWATVVDDSGQLRCEAVEKGYSELLWALWTDHRTLPAWSSFERPKSYDSTFYPIVRLSLGVPTVSWTNHSGRFTQWVDHTLVSFNEEEKTWFIWPPNAASEPLPPVPKVHGLFGHVRATTSGEGDVLYIAASGGGMGSDLIFDAHYWHAQAEAAEVTSFGNFASKMNPAITRSGHAFYFGANSEEGRLYERKPGRDRTWEPVVRIPKNGVRRCLESCDYPENLMDAFPAWFVPIRVVETPDGVAWLTLLVEHRGQENFPSSCTCSEIWRRGAEPDAQWRRHIYKPEGERANVIMPLGNDVLLRVDSYVDVAGVYPGSVTLTKHYRLRGDHCIKNEDFDWE